MAYDERLAERVRKALARRKGLTERKMFGGIGFMLRGNLCCGVMKDELILRLGPEAAEEAMKKKGARAFDFTGRTMKSMLMVGPAGYRGAKALESWVRAAADFAGNLEPK